MFCYSDFFRLRKSQSDNDQLNEENNETTGNK